MKQTRVIRLNAVDKIKSFVARAAAYPGDIFVRNGRFTVDGKSIMGLFSLNLSCDLILETDCDVPVTFAEDFCVAKSM